MNPEDLPPEFLFLSSPAGVLVAVLGSLALMMLTLIWASRPGYADRWRTVGAASLTSLLIIAISMVAVRQGWWQGAFFNSVPILVQAAFDIPFSVAGYSLWLGIYRSLALRVRYGRWIYAFIVLLFIPIVFIADSFSMQRGQFSFGSGYTVWTDALVGQTVLWSPAVFYEWLHRWQRAD